MEPRTSVYLKSDVREMAKTWCEKNHRPMSYLVTVALKEFLKKNLSVKDMTDGNS